MPRGSPHTARVAGHCAPFGARRLMGAGMRYLLCLLGAVLVVACGSTSTPTTSGGGPSATFGGDLGPGAILTVTGSVSASVHEISNTANKCQTAAGGDVSAILAFDTYSLQFAIPTGTTTFPNTSGHFGVAFFNNNDFTQEWAASAGTVTLSADAKSGTVDVDMSPHPPRPNPALKPIHVKGTFTCS